MNAPYRLFTASLALACSPWIAVSSAKAETWTNGGADNSYFNPLNWSPTEIPNSSSALIFQGSNDSVVFDGQTGYASSADFLDSSVTTFNMGGGLFDLGTGAINASDLSTVTFQDGEVRAGRLNLTSGAAISVNSIVTLAPAADEGSEPTAVSVHSSTLSVLSGGNLTIQGSDAAQPVLFNVDGNSNLAIGSNGEMNLENTVAVLGDSNASLVHFTHGQGVVRVSDSSRLYLAGSGVGTYRLETGGVLEIGGNSLQGNRDISGQYEFQLAGGKIRVTGADLNTSIDSVITDGRTVLDTNGYDAIWSGNIETSETATGGREFAKEGSGKLTFSGTSRTMYAFATLGGETVQTGGNTESTAFLVGYGAGNSASYDLEGGSITISGSSGSLRIGDYGGTGIFNHRGGTVTLEAGTSLNLGNLSQVRDSVRYNGHGTYNLYDGTLTLNGGLHNIGRSNGSNNSSSGEMNILGGELIVQGGGNLIIGSRDSSGGLPLGTGIVTQTGGVADFTDGKLYISGYGDGEYHLNGGTLRVAGSNLNSRYNNTTSSYLFSLGGGTIEVAEANLTTNVSATLVANTESTINTNEVDATFSGSITGSGNLRKQGTGKLTIAQTLQATEIDVTEGTLQAGTLNASLVKVNQASLRTNSLSATELLMTDGNVGSVSGTFVLGSASKMEGTGVIATDANLQGTVRSGSETAAGVISAEENLTLADGSTFLWTIFNNSNQTGDNNLIEVNGILTIQTGVTFSLSFGESVDFTNDYWSQSGMSWLLIASTQANSFSLSDISLITSGADYSEYGSFRLAETSEGIAVEWEAVPEPSTYALILLAYAGWTLSRRRR